MRGLSRPAALLGPPGDIRLALIELAAVGRIGEPVAAVGMRHDVVWRVELLALIGVGDHGRRTVVLVACDAAREMLAGELPALEVERIAVAVVRGCAEHADAAVVLRPSHLPVIRNVAPYQIAPLRAPRRPFGPQHAGIEPLDRGIRLRETVEARVDRDDVRVPEICGGCAPRAEVARRIGDGARRRRGSGLRRRSACCDHRSGTGRQRLDHRSTR